MEDDVLELAATLRPELRILRVVPCPRGAPTLHESTLSKAGFSRKGHEWQGDRGQLAVDQAGGRLSARGPRRPQSAGSDVGMARFRRGPTALSSALSM